MSTTTITNRNEEIIEESEQSPLALLFTEQFRDIFETHIVPKLRPKSDLKFLKMAFKNARDAIERSKIDLEHEFNIRELTSISRLELACWDTFLSSIRRWIYEHSHSETFLL